MMTLSAGVFMIPEFSATGGVTYRRTGASQEQTGDILEADFSTHKTVDHVGLVSLSKSIVNRAYHVLDKLAVNTPVGYFAPAEKVAQIREGLAPIQTAAAEFNAAAKMVGSMRRCNVSVYMVQIAEDNESAANRLALVVRERLSDLREALAQGDLKAYGTAWDRCKNLHKLATGIQSDSIRLAIDCAREAKATLVSRTKAGATVAEANVDLNALDAAISLFQDAVELGASTTDEAGGQV
jgi:hypothetical protein